MEISELTNTIIIILMIVIIKIPTIQKNLS